MRLAVTPARAPSHRRSALHATTLSRTRVSFGPNHAARRAAQHVLDVGAVTACAARSASGSRRLAPASARSDRVCRRRRSRFEARTLSRWAGSFVAIGEPRPERWRRSISITSGAARPRRSKLAASAAPLKPAPTMATRLRVIRVPVPIGRHQAPPVCRHSAPAAALPHPIAHGLRRLAGITALTCNHLVAY